MYRRTCMDYYCSRCVRYSTQNQDVFYIDVVKYRISAKAIRMIVIAGGVPTFEVQQQSVRVPNDVVLFDWQGAGTACVAPPGLAIMQEAGWSVLTFQVSVQRSLHREMLASLASRVRRTQ